MRRKIFTLVLLFLFSAVSILPLAISDNFRLNAEETKIWDGTVANSFESGSGTENDPYIIKTPAQLAYLSKTVKEGNCYEGEYIKLVSDIIMNDEIFTFESDSGLVKVTDGTEVIYLGTGIKGDKSSVSGVFDVAASEIGKLYESDLSEKNGVYSGELNTFTPIGHLAYPFAGTFDGCSHSVSGLYIKAVSKDRVGLFSCTDEAYIQNLIVENSYISGHSFVGAVVGEASFSTVENCYSDAILCGEENVGGISGSLVDSEIFSSYNIGTVCGSTVIGGIVGTNGGKIRDVYNAGVLYADNNAGGIVGKNNGSLETSYNAGMVIAERSAGALIGTGQGSVKNVYYINGSLAGDTLGFTESQMKDKESFYGFDFDTVWEIGVSDGFDYPTLVAVKHKICAHIYDNACDSLCNLCGRVRDVSHSYETLWSMSESGHFHKCSVCGDEGEKFPHIYDDNCDSICNACEYDRNTFHSYATAWSSDKNAHWHECLSCGDKKNVEEHIPSKEATDTSAQICTICEYVIKEPIGHKHSFVSSWKSDEETHYKECSCGERSSAEAHRWNDGEITKAPSENEEGIRTYLCTVCAAKKTEKIDKLPSETDIPLDSEDEQNNTSDDANDNEDTENGKSEQNEDKIDSSSGEDDSSLSLALGVAAFVISLLNLFILTPIIVVLTVLLKRKNKEKNEEKA